MMDKFSRTRRAHHNRGRIDATELQEMAAADIGAFTYGDEVHERSFPVERKFRWPRVFFRKKPQRNQPEGEMEAVIEDLTASHASDEDQPVLPPLIRQDSIQRLETNNNNQKPMLSSIRRKILRKPKYVNIGHPIALPPSTQPSTSADESNLSMLDRWKQTSSQ